MKRNKNFYLNRIIAILICLVIALGVVLTPVIAKELLTNNDAPISEYALVNNEANSNTPESNLNNNKNNLNTPKTKSYVNTVKARSANSSFGLKPGQYVDIDLTNNNEGISQIAVQFSKDDGSTWSDQVIAERLGNDSKKYNEYDVHRSKVYEAIAPSGFENYNSIKIINKNNGNEITANLADNQIGTDIAFKFWNDFVNGGQWITYYSSSQEINVNKLIDKDGTNELYPLKTTLYDYYTENEVINGWGNALEDESRRAYDPKPQNTFNGFIGLFVESKNNWLYPLYFGNFYGKDDNYFPNFKNKVNNSSNLANYNTSVRNLVDKKLSANGNIQSNGIELPIFDSSFLANNNIGQTVNTVLPFRRYNKEDNGNLKYYGFNSDISNTFNNDGIVDNVWFSRNNSLWQNTSSGEWQINYSNDPKYRINDAASQYSADPDRVGFFPFDTATAAGGNTNNNAWNFGFGMKSEVNFYLPSGGAEDGEDLKFEYTGDDDLWVFLDGVLVLDIGGDHKKSGGEIDFATLKSTYKNNGYDVTNDQTYAPNRVEEFPSLFGSDGNQQFNNDDPLKVHKLTMFYMERGMVESNFHLNFVLTPTYGELELEKEVNVANVNNGLKDYLIKTNDFKFNIYKDKDTKGSYSPLANFEYKYMEGDNFLTKRTDSNGGLNINSNYISKFNDPYFEGDSAKIIEADTSPMIYNTTYEMTDLDTGDFIKNGSGKELEFPWEQLKSMGEIIGRHVKFINDPYLSNLVVTKKVVNPDDTEVEDKDVTNDFEFKLELNLGAGEAYSPYKLSYSKTDKYGNVTEGTLSKDGYFQLNNKDSINFSGLPQGITYKVVEIPKSGYTTTEYIRTGTLNDSKIEVDYVNEIFKTKISLVKYFDGNVETTADRFTFNLYEKINDQYNFIEEKKNNSDGTVSFSGLEYMSAGVHYYKIDEVDTVIPTINYGKSIYAKVEVQEDATKGLISTVTYYEDEQYTKVLEQPRIDNSTKLGNITIKKVDRDTQLGLKGAKFKLVPAKIENGVWSDLTPTSFDEAVEYVVENDDGTLTFTNLNIGDTIPYYYQLYETEAPSNHQLLGSPIKITIDENTTNFSGITWNYNETILVNDAENNVLPLTGGTGWMVLGIMAIIFLIAGAITYFRKGKRME